MGCAHPNSTAPYTSTGTPSQRKRNKLSQRNLVRCLRWYSSLLCRLRSERFADLVKVLPLLALNASAKRYLNIKAKQLYNFTIKFQGNNKAKKFQGICYNSLINERD